MDNSRTIDITFNFCSDTPPGKDPDTASPTLRRYHKLLWSKPLPCGTMFSLVDTDPHAYLHHRSHLGEFRLASDAVIPSFRKQKHIKHILDQIQAELASFNNLGYTIGGMMLFPGNRVGNCMTINGERGCHPKIKDRFDLTVECIRRHYANEGSPLADALARYREFFHLYGDFRGYVDFFLLQDMVAEDGSSVAFFSPFDDFRSSPVPDSMDAYLAYRKAAIAFIDARNQRIQAWWAAVGGALPAANPSSQS